MQDYGKCTKRKENVLCADGKVQLQESLTDKEPITCWYNRWTFNCPIITFSTVRQGRKLLKSTDITRVSVFLSSASTWDKNRASNYSSIKIFYWYITQGFLVLYRACFSSKSTTNSIRNIVLCFVNKSKVQDFLDVQKRLDLAAIVLKPNSLILFMFLGIILRVLRLEASVVEPEPEPEQ